MACATSNLVLITEKMARRYPEEHDDDGLSDDDNHHSGDDDIINHLNKLSLHVSENECEIVSHTDTSNHISTSEDNELNSYVNENTIINDTATDVQKISINNSSEGSVEDEEGQGLPKKKEDVKGRGPMNGCPTSISRDQRPAKPGSRRDEQYNDEESEVPSKFSNPGSQQPYPDTTPCYPSQQINSNVISGFNSFSIPTIQKQTARQALEFNNVTSPGMFGLNQYQQFPPYPLNAIPNPDFNYSSMVYKNEYNNNCHERSLMDILGRPTCIPERQNLLSSNCMQPLDGHTRNVHVTQNGRKAALHHLSPGYEGVSCRSSISSESGFCSSQSDSPPAPTLNSISESKYQPYYDHTSEVGHDEDDDSDKFVRDLMNMYGVTQDDDIENTVVDTDRSAETRRSERQETLRNPSENTWHSNYNSVKNVQQMLPVTTASAAYPFVNTTTPNINFVPNGVYRESYFHLNQSDQKPKMYDHNVFNNNQFNNQSKASGNIHSFTKQLDLHNASNGPEFHKSDLFPNDLYLCNKNIANNKLKDNMIGSSTVQKFQPIPEVRINSVIGNNTNSTTASKGIDNNYLENNAYGNTGSNNDKHRENFVAREDQRSTSSVGSYLSARGSPRSLDSFNTLLSPDVTSPASVQSSSSPDTTDTPDPVDDEEKRILAHRAVAALSTRDLLQADEHLDTELHRSVIDCDYYMVDALIDRYKRDETLDQVVNAKNNNLQTPLCLSVILNEPRIAELLIMEGADTNAIVRRTARGSDGKPSASFDHLIHFSASRGEDWLKVLRHLLNSSTTKINSFNSEGQTAVHCAVLAHNKPPKVPSSKITAGVINSVKTIAALSMAGANLNLPDQSSGKTPLHCAIEERDHDLVHRILSTAARKDQQSENSLGNILSAKTNSGNTALHLAASVKMSEDAQIRLVRLLISKGADPSTKNGDGLLPREVAVYPAIVKLLKGSCSSPSSRYS